MAKKHHGLYDESPSIKHEEGKAKVVKAPKSENKESDKGVSDEGYPVHAKHSMERHLMHAKHEMEHGMHDHQHGASGKEEVHTRHEKERKEMNTRHEKEAGADGGKAAGAGGATGEPIEKVQKNAKS